MPTSKQPDPKLVALGRSVGHLREQHAMTPSKLAAEAGLTQRRLRAIEAGEVDPTYDVLLALAHGLGVEVEYLVRIARELSRPHEAH